MKILDKYILKSFIVTFLTVFVILFFIFILQGIWLYITELAGKDLDLATIGKFLIYFSPTMVPLVLPLSVLLAGIMTFGSFAENYEFAAMKSAGISLNRAMRSLIYFILGLALVSFYFANTVIPQSQFKFQSLRKNILQLKPAMAIAEGQFSPIGNFSIKVKKKSGDRGQFLEDVIIHKRNSYLQNTTVIVAKKGVLTSSKDGNSLQLELLEGYYYEDIIPTDFNERNKHPFAKSTFTRYVMTIDISALNKAQLDANNFGGTHVMMNVGELKYTIDSLNVFYKKDVKSFADNVTLRTDSYFKTPTNTAINISKTDENTDDLLALLNDDTQKRNAIDAAKNSVSGIQFSIETSKNDLEAKKKHINLHWVFLYDKFVIAYSVLLMFFIGAPLGAIIRKGGLGLPIVFAVLIFLTFHFLNLFGKKMAQQDGLEPILGCWMSALALTPLAILLTYRATNDVGLTANYSFKNSRIINYFKKLFSKKEIETHEF